MGSRPLVLLEGTWWKVWPANCHHLPIHQVIWTQEVPGSIARINGEETYRDYAYPEVSPFLAYALYACVRVCVCVCERGGKERRHTHGLPCSLWSTYLRWSGSFSQSSSGDCQSKQRMDCGWAGWPRAPGLPAATNQGDTGRAWTWLSGAFLLHLFRLLSFPFPLRKIKRMLYLTAWKGAGKSISGG